MWYSYGWRPNRKNHLQVKGSIVPCLFLWPITKDPRQELGAFFFFFNRAFFFVTYGLFWHPTPPSNASIPPLAMHPPPPFTPRKCSFLLESLGMGRHSSKFGQISSDRNRICYSFSRMFQKRKYHRVEKTKKQQSPPLLSWHHHPLPHFAPTTAGIKKKATEGLGDVSDTDTTASLCLGTPEEASLGRMLLRLPEVLEDLEEDLFPHRRGKLRKPPPWSILY